MTNNMLTVNAKIDNLIPMDQMKHGDVGIITNPGNSLYNGYVILFNRYYKGYFTINTNSEFTHFDIGARHLVRLLKSGESFTWSKE